VTKVVTGHDVARLAGVSQATVSRAIRNLPGTAPETRAAVLAAAAALDYLPSDSGRVLSTRSTRRVAVVVEEMTNPFYPELVEPLQLALLARGLRTVLVSDHGDGEPRAQLQQLADGSYDGVVLTTTIRGSRLPRDLSERGIPHVLMNRVLDHPESPSCTFDNISGATQVAQLLVELGHESIAAIHGPVATSSGSERATALRAALRLLGAPLKRTSTRRASVFSHDAGYHLARDLLTKPDRPTAIACGNDVLAMGVLSAARSLNIAVPAELTVVGYDDIALSSWPLVNLTTVRCDLSVLATDTVAMLMLALRGEQLCEIKRVPVTLIRRGSHRHLGDGVVIDDRHTRNRPLS